ncbi:MAG: cyclase family protein [Gammaproteobacteria bacterium]|nr:cyclase family protein [Gammaproteobacteria bacterium]
MTNRMLDLSHPVKDGMITYPGLPPPAIGSHMSRAESTAHYGVDTRFHIGRIEMVANTGTYIDAPFHRFEDQPDIAGLRLECLADLPGICIEASAGRKVDVGAFDNLEVNGRAVLIRTGWSQHFGTERYGKGHPFLTSSAARLLAEQGAVLAGIDSLNIDDTDDSLRPAHTILLAAGIPIVEHMRGLSALVGQSFRFFAVPAPVAGLGSFPVRAFAILNNQAATAQGQRTL